MRILQYSQHLLGVGHLFRSLAIATALTQHDPENNRLVFVDGGQDAQVPLPEGIKYLSLPALRMDASFSRLLPVHAVSCPMQAQAQVEEIKRIRRKKLLDCCLELQPDIILLELYPFGRKQFEFELLPLLRQAKQGAFGTVRTVCSVRDILVEKKNQAAYEERVLSRLEAFFDAVLVHADPALVCLDESFARTPDIAVPLHYTGYVTPAPERLFPSHKQQDKTADTVSVIASAGSGSIGAPFLQACIAASGQMHTDCPHQLDVFAGPFMAEKDYSALARAAAKHSHISLARFAHDFPARLAKAALSLSLGGYNTTLNLLTARTCGLVYPFEQNQEQGMRARRLEKHGFLKVLSKQDCAPAALAAHIQTALHTPYSPTLQINTNGAQETAAILLGKK